MSDRVEKRILELLDSPSVSPYGNPIPGLRELGQDTADVEFLTGVQSLPKFVADEQLGHGDARSVVVVRLGEPLQTDIELLKRLAGAGIKPQSRVNVEVGDDVLAVGAPSAHTVLDLPPEVARHIFVATPEQ